MNFRQKVFLPIAASAVIIASGQIYAEEAQPEQAPAATTAAMDADTMATVNGEAVTRNQFAAYFQTRMKTQPGMQVTPQVQGAAFSDLLKVYALAQAAEKDGLDKLPEVQDALLVKRKEVLAQVAMLNFLDKHPVDQEAVKKLYDERVGSDKKTEFKARHILVASEDDAKKLIVELDGGADFVELAKTRSTGPSGPNGGDLGWFQSTQMVEPFANAVAAMEKGKYSKEPVQTQFGWHVILLEDIREVDPPTLDQMRPQLEAEVKQQALRDYIVGVQNASDVQINEELAKPVSSEQAPPESGEQPAAETKE